MFLRDFQLFVDLNAFSVMFAYMYFIKPIKGYKTLIYNIE